MIAEEINPDKIKRVDLIVGIPSYKEAGNIHYPVEQAALGLKQFFQDKRTVIINCDNNSPDGTKEAFMSAPTGGIPRIYLSTPTGVKGKGNNFRNLFIKAKELKAKGVVVVDADLQSITPKWIRNLGEPLFKGYSFVAPLYIRHKYDGTITNNIAYPVSRCLYGRRVRQPIGGDFGFSGRMLDHYLDSALWNENIANFGIDIWMYTLAVAEGMKVCQTFLGKPKIHKVKDPGSDLGPMFIQVIGTLFNLMGDFTDIWKRVKWSKPTAIFGFGLGEVELPPPIEVNMPRLMENFHKGKEEFEGLWQEVLNDYVYDKLMEVSELPDHSFELPTSLWAKILFDFAIYSHLNGNGDKLLESLIPLYFARTASFVKDTETLAPHQAEEYVEEQCLIFEEVKPYLVNRWNELK